MGSGRFAGKVLAPVGGQPLLERLLRRVERCQNLDGVAVLVPSGPRDDPLREHCLRLRVECLSGSEDDVLGRFCTSAEALGVEHVVRLTADCPLIDPELVDELVSQYRGGSSPYAALVTGWAPAPPAKLRYPHGLDAEVVHVQALRRACTESQDPADREHVTRYLIDRPEEFPPLLVGAPEEHGELRWTVDYEEDLAFVRSVFSKLQEPFGWRDVVELSASSGS